MLDTRFPRPRGDVGHPETFAWPVRQAIVRGAAPADIVTSAHALRSSGLAPAFAAALQSLQAQGALALTTSCGFLVLLQEELQAAVRVPLVTSSLLQLPGLLRQHARVGVMTADATSLGEAHLRAAGVPAARLRDVVVQGMPADGEFAGAILGNRSSLDQARVEAEAVQAARALRTRAPSVQHVVLECTNLPPYADAIRAVTGWSLYDLACDARLQQAMFSP